MLNPKKSVNKPFLENVLVYIQNFLAAKFDIFKRIFSSKVEFEANKETKMILGGSEANEETKMILGSGGMLPQKIFENLHTVMGILALFGQFVTQVLFFCP